MALKGNGCSSSHTTKAVGVYVRQAVPPRGARTQKKKGSGHHATPHLTPLLLAPTWQALLRVHGHTCW